MKFLLKSMLQLMSGVFHSKEKKQNGSISVNLGLLKVLLNLQKRKICCIRVFLVTLTLPMKMHTSPIKTNLCTLFNLLSVYIMKNKLRS